MSVSAMIGWLMFVTAMTAGSAVAAAVRDILSKVLHNNLNNITTFCLQPNIKHLEGKIIHVFIYT